MANLTGWPFFLPDRGCAPALKIDASDLHGHQCIANIHFPQYSQYFPPTY
jgi:hypothetical protein